MVRYPYNGFLTPGMDIVSPTGEFDNSTGWFKVFKYKKDDEGNLLEVVISFELTNSQYMTLEGAFHYTSKPIEKKLEYENNCNDNFSELDSEVVNTGEHFWHLQPKILRLQNIRGTG